MTDKYRSFEQLRKYKKSNRDYRIVWRKGETGSIIVAPHGGSIEPGTTEIADAVAGGDHSFYTFEGIRTSGNRDLHITSTKFDEPRGVKLIRESTKVVALHGCAGGEEIVYLGGLDAPLREKVRDALTRGGFKTGVHDNPELQGIHRHNICNRGRRGQGVQLEISSGLRKKMFRSLRAKDSSETTARFDDFVSSLRESLRH